MMTRLILSAAALAALVLPGAASAQVTGTVNLTGSVANRCLFTTPSATIQLGELSLTGGAAADMGRLNAAKVNTATASLNGWCNGTAATMTVEAQPIVNTAFTGAPPTGFERRVDYTATATAQRAAGGASAASDTTVNAGAGAASSLGLFSSDVVLTFADASTPSGGRLIAGGTNAYAGQVVVTLNPAP